MKKLNFTNFFNIDECGTVIQGGRMQYYNHNNQDGLLLRQEIISRFSKW